MGCGLAKTPHIPRLRSSKLQNEKPDASMHHFSSGSSQQFSKKHLLENSQGDEQTEAEIAALEKAVAEKEVAYDECGEVRIKDKAETLNRKTSQAVSGATAMPAATTRRTPTALADILQDAVNQATAENEAKKTASVSRSGVTKPSARTEHSCKLQGDVSDVKAVVGDRRPQSTALEASQARTLQADDLEARCTSNEGDSFESKPSAKLAAVLQDAVDGVSANDSALEEAKVSASAPSAATSSTALADKDSENEQFESFGITSPDSTEMSKVEEPSLSSLTPEEGLQTEAESACPKQALSNAPLLTPCPAPQPRRLTLPPPSTDEFACNDDTQARPVDFLTISGTTQPTCAGTYTRTSIPPGICNAGRVIYKGPGAKYLFFWADIDKWIIGDDYNSCKGCLTSTGSSTCCPSQASGWREWDYDSREFNKADTVKAESCQIVTMESTIASVSKPSIAGIVDSNSNETGKKPMLQNDPTISEKPPSASASVTAAEEEDIVPRVPRHNSRTEEEEVQTSSATPQTPEVHIAKGDVQSQSSPENGVAKSLVAERSTISPDGKLEVAIEEDLANCRTPRKSNAVSISKEATPPKLQLPAEERPIVTNAVRSPTLMTSTPTASSGSVAKQPKDCTSKQPALKTSENTVDLPVTAPPQSKRKSSTSKLKKVPTLETSDMVLAKHEKRKSTVASEEVPPHAASNQAIEGVPEVAENAAQNLRRTRSKDGVELPKIATKQKIDRIPAVAQIAPQISPDPKVQREEKEKKKSSSKNTQMIEGDSAVAEIARQNTLESERSREEKKRHKAATIELNAESPAVAEIAAQDSLASKAPKKDEEKKRPKATTTKVNERDSEVAETAAQNPLPSQVSSKKRDKDAPTNGTTHNRKSLPPPAPSGSTGVIAQTVAPVVSSSRSPDANTGTMQKSKKSGLPAGDGTLPVPQDREGSSLRAVANGQDKARKKDESKAKEFRVTIHRKGSKLGLEAETNSDGTMMLIVHHVREGPVLDWNRANPSRAIRGGDMIIEVNGVAGNAYKIVPVMEVADPLELLIRRPRPLAKLDEACHV